MENFYYKKDRLNQLRGFCTTVQEHSIIKAAAILHVEPTTVSKQIRALERDLKTELFDRKTKKQRLLITEKGKEFYKVAIVALQNIESVFNYFYDTNYEEKAKEIRITAHHTIFMYLVPQYIKKFREEFPESEFCLNYLNLEHALEDLKNDKTDIVLYPIDKKYNEFDTFQLYDLEPVVLINAKNKLATKPDNEITFEDLSKQNMLMIDNDRILPYFEKVCSEFNISSSISFTNTDWEMIRTFVKLDLGIHLYTELYNIFPIFKDEDIITKKVSKLFPNVKVNLMIKKGKIQTDIVNKFIEEIKKYSQKEI